MGCNPDALYLCLQSDLCRFTASYDVDAPPPDLTVKQFASVSLLKSFYKKYVERKSAEADRVAFDKFIAINSKCMNWSLDLQTSKDEILLGELKHALYNFWYKNGYSLVHSANDLLDHGRTGPGASVNANGNDFYTKLFSSPLSCTSRGLYDMYEHYVQDNPIWQAAEETRRQEYGDCLVVEGNKLNFVPKTVDVSRTICTEPNLNMFFQLGLGHILERRLKEVFGIDLSKQPDKNRELARIGSRDDSYSTIDLSSASDSLSLKMLELVLPKPFFEWLKLVRSSTTSYQGESHELHMVSTMGNGSTFPLQTILFSCIVLACSKCSGYKLQYPYGNRLGNFAVFGDDIIVDKSISADVIRLLELLGFSVNANKSFVEGPFRESCGSDFYFGQNVRGVYVKSLRTQQDRYVTINALNLWSARVGIPLPETVQYLLSHTKYQPVPVWDSEDAGIRVPYSLIKNLRRDRHTDAILYNRSVAVSDKMKIGEKVILVSKYGKKRIYNPSGLYLAFLRGDIRKSTISIQRDRPRYCTKAALAPCWDYYGLGPDVSSVLCSEKISGLNRYLRSQASIEVPARRQESALSQGFVTWRHWESAVYSNFML